MPQLTNKTIEMRAGEELDTAVIDALMKEQIGGLTGVPEIRQFASGQSNLTYSITYGASKFVLRRPPFGTKPKSGHSMIREYRVMNALKAPFGKVPDTYFYCSDEDSPLGSEFYVMEQVAGHKLGRVIPADFNFSEAQTRALCEAFFDTLIDLHKVDYQAAGLGDFGKPKGYARRQVEGWNSRYERVITEDVPAFEDLRAWFAARIPETETGAAIVHGDYRLDNVILNAANPLQIDAVLDWEISALGDPLMDLGNTLAYWMEASDPPDVQMLSMQPSAAPGMMTRAEIVDRYQAKMGIDCSGFDYYLAFGVFRLAVILQQIYFRYASGQTRNKNFAGFGAQVKMLGRYAEKLAEQSGL